MSSGRVITVVLLAGCGRIGFDGAAHDATIDTGPTVCGDRVCAGEQGELCTSCAADCVTLARACGNGACEAGEDDACPADCGPTPWPWAGDGALMLAAVNEARATGITCPGGAGGQMLPPLTYDGSLEPTAREWAWEAAHQGWTPADGCNGRSAEDRVAAAGVSSIWKAFGATTASEGAAMLIAFGPACAAIMDTENTSFAGTGAHDMIDCHAIVLK